MIELAKSFGFGIVALLYLSVLYIDISRSWQGGLAGFLFINIPLYMLPTIIAGYRVHPNTAGVAVLNFLLGWTGFGWVAALAWSFANPPPLTTLFNQRNRPRWSQKWKASARGAAGVTV